MKTEVPKPLFDKMCRGNQCKNLSEGYVSKTFFFQNKEIVITGTMSSAAAGYSCIWGHYVVDIDLYKDELKPVDREEYWKEVMKGKRQRGYKAQKTKFGERTIVLIGEVLTFVPVNSGIQLELF